MKSSQHIKIVVLVAVLTIAAGLAFFYIFSIITKSFRDMKNLAVDIAAETNTQQAIQTVERNIKDTEVLRNDLDSHFITKDDIVKFFDDLEAQATTADVKIKITSAIEPTLVGDPLIFTIQATGTFGAEYRFMELLENMPYELSTDSMKLNYGTNNSVLTGVRLPSEWNLTLGLRLLTYSE